MAHQEPILAYLEELKDSHKLYLEDPAENFWEISIEGCDVTTRFGKPGGKPRSRTKTLESIEAALEYATQRTWDQFLNAAYRKPGDH